jgi:hypothetical protein
MRGGEDDERRVSYWTDEGGHWHLVDGRLTDNQIGELFYRASRNNFEIRHFEVIDDRRKEVGVAGDGELVEVGDEGGL